MRWKTFVNNTAILMLITILLGGSVSIPSRGVERVRGMTRAVEFDYLSWMLDALAQKGAQGTLDLPRYMTPEVQRAAVETYLDLVHTSSRLDSQINQIFVNPDVENPEQAAAELLEQRDELEIELERWGRLAEAVIQAQTSEVLAEEGLDWGGQLLPPLLYQVTPLPLALIVSPRDVIRQDADISLLPDLDLAEITALEEKVEREMNVSALVTRVGGVGVYPTMVMRTANLPWLVDTVVHEWAHNYLTLRPLGMRYYASGQLRTMNETTASIVGEEVGAKVLSRYYPEYLPGAGTPVGRAWMVRPGPPTPPEFDFRKEMHETRVTVDELLAQGKVEEAEEYMEARREVFVQNGYAIRKLNQAYFAFHGAYADAPVGAFGRDPVGPLVQELREQSPTLKAFIQTIARITSFEELQKRVGG